MFALQIVRPVEFLLDIGGHGIIELGLHGGKIIIDGIGQALREKRFTVEFEQIFLHQAAHDIRNIYGLIACAAYALEAIRVDQGHK